MTVGCQVVKFVENKKTVAEDLVVHEYPLTIYFNGQELVTLLCSSNNLEALALGFLRTEGLISDISEISSLRLSEEKGIIEIKNFKQGTLSEKLYSKRLVPTGCGSCGKGGLFYNIIDSIKCKPVKSDLTISPNQIYDFMEQTLSYSQVYKLTAGVHSAALFDQENLLILCEDVARHNAMDKVIGQALMENIFLQNKFIVISGRVSSEMLLKVAKLGIPILISKSAPTHLAVELAKELKVTLISFVRGNKMTIYANEERVT